MGIQRLTVGSPHKETVTQSFDISFDVNPN